MTDLLLRSLTEMAGAAIDFIGLVLAGIMFWFLLMLFWKK